MNVLLLQGPMSPFFKLMSAELLDSGAHVSKINFNGGDEFYYPGPHAYSYRGTTENWSQYLRSFVLTHRIKMIVGYGDCRFYHRIAKVIAAELSIAIYFFEEGYFRPHWITLERGGVNAHSPLSNMVLSERRENPEQSSVKIPDHFRQRAVFCALYYIAAALRRQNFPHYQHHRVLSVTKEMFWWGRSGFRKCLYKSLDFWKWSRTKRAFSRRYFLVPLQIRDDAQIQFHSPYSNLEEFLKEVIGSFSRNAPKDSCLLIKHHPMDRGHTHYGKAIRRLRFEYGVQDRVVYIHDVSNPKLLRQALGVVTINSTMGISGLIHGRKVITLGSALYDQIGLTYQGSLDDFWQSPFEPDEHLLREFRHRVIEGSQILGSFYYFKFKIKLPNRFYQDLFRKKVTRLIPARKIESSE